MTSTPSGYKLHPGCSVWDLEEDLSMRDKGLADPMYFHLAYSALEYVIRALHKGGRSDIAKAISCLDKALAFAPIETDKIIDDEEML